MIVFGAATAPGPAEAEGPLQLDVLLNGKPSGLIGAFLQNANGELSAKRKELEELHLKVPDRYRAEDEVALAGLPGVSYRYDEARQSVDITVADAGRLPQLYDLRGPGKPLPDTQSSTGAVLNYLLFEGGGGRNSIVTNWQFQGASATLDARLFSPYGIVSQTGILASNTGGGVISQHLRLDSTWTYKDPERILTYRAGDTIWSGLAWTRPVRLGGLQVQRDFATRPDLVTLPLPSFSGSAAVPSTVDVYVNNVRTISQDVDGGPFRLTNLPILSGQGNASIIVRDSSGRDVETTLPFLVSNKLLRGGLLDFSAEAGVPRLFYGARSNVYAGAPAGSASLRCGFSDRLTLEGHAEATNGLANGGIGASLGIDRAGVFSAAFAGSTHGGSSGGQVYAGFDTTLFGLSFSASTLRTLGTYDDLVSVTAKPFGFALAGSVPPGAFAPGWFFQNPLWLVRPPNIQDQLSIGLPLPLLGGAINLDMSARSISSEIARSSSMSATRGNCSTGPLCSRGFCRSGRPQERRYFPRPLDSARRRCDGVQRSEPRPVRPHRRKRRNEASARGTRQLRLAVVGFGRQTTSAFGERRLSRRSRQGRGDSDPVAIGLCRNDIAGGRGRRGRRRRLFRQPDRRRLRNRRCRRARHRGVLRKPAGRPHGRERQGDRAFAERLPAQQDFHRSARFAARCLDRHDAGRACAGRPQRRFCRFRDKDGVHSAIVILDGPNGQPLQAGLRGKTASGQNFAVGYEGRAFIEGLDPQNTVTVALASGECRAEFAYAPQGNAQGSIGPVVCR